MTYTTILHNVGATTTIRLQGPQTEAGRVPAMYVINRYGAFTVEQGQSWASNFEGNR